MILNMRHGKTKIKLVWKVLNIITYKLPAVWWCGDSINCHIYWISFLYKLTCLLNNQWIWRIHKKLRSPLFVKFLFTYFFRQDANSQDVEFQLRLTLYDAANKCFFGSTWLGPYFPSSGKENGRHKVVCDEVCKKKMPELCHTKTWDKVNSG